MSAETEQFRQLWADKTAAKQKAFEAWHTALWLDADPETRSKEPAIPDWLVDATSAECWAFMDTYGKNGTEGEKAEAAELLCIATVVAHPMWFTVFVGKTVEQVVQLVDAYRDMGLEDDSTLATMYEMATWERQNIGGEVAARLRITGIGG